MNSKYIKSACNENTQCIRNGRYNKGKNRCLSVFYKNETNVRLFNSIFRMVKKKNNKERMMIIICIFFYVYIEEV